jgi:hypothetical protein
VFYLSSGIGTFMPSPASLSDLDAHDGEVDLSMRYITTLFLITKADSPPSSKQ